MRTNRAKTLLMLPLLLAAFALAACGGGSDADDSGGQGGAESTQPGRGGGLFANLSDEDVECLKDQGVTLPERPEGAPEGMPEGGPPEGMPEGGPPEEMPEGGPPEGMPEGGPPEGLPEGMEDLQAAMSECGIELPGPPGDGESRGSENRS